MISDTMMHRSCKHLAALAAAGLTATSAVAIQFDNESSDGTWETPINWVGDVLPGAPDAAELFGSQTITLNSTQSIGQIQLGDSVVAGSPGIATLNLPAGSSLTVASGNNRIGREVSPGNLGEAAGHLIISGGSFVSQGSVRMSYDKTNSADSLIEISAGSFQNLTNFVHVGRETRNFNRAEFRVVGSAATTLFTEDMRIRQGANGGAAVMAFQIDAGGVTTFVVNDELGLLGATLDISMIDDYDPSNGDIRLFDAGRLTDDEIFAGLIQGATVSASTALFTYDWSIHYIDNDVVDGGIYLRNLVRRPIPEPTALAAGLLAGVALLARRRS